MVWKSERWQSKVDALQGDVGGEIAAFTKSEAEDPQTLEIVYRRGDTSEVQREHVFEDAEDTKKPRLLVSLHAVNALQQLCEHEHARYDKVVVTLTQCRAAYYKELSFLRQQLHLACQTGQEAAKRRGSIAPEDFEVYWFEPPNYLDPDTKEFLLTCIRETNRKLIDELGDLRVQLDRQSALLQERGEVTASVIRQLRKDQPVGKILRELHAQLRTRPDELEFEETARELLLGAAAAPSPGSMREAPRERALIEERDQLLKKLAESEALVEKLRCQLSTGIDVKLERERAEAERARAELVQKRAERLELQQRILEKELRESGTSVGERTRRVQRSVSKLSSALVCLSPPSSLPCSPQRSPAPIQHVALAEFEEDPEEMGFEEALSHLDNVASGFETVAQEVLSELLELRARLATSERNAAAAAALAAAAAADRSKQPSTADEEAAAAAAAERAALRRAAEEEAAQRAAAVARAGVLQKEVEELKARLQEEQRKSAKLRGELGETQPAIDQLNGRILWFKDKVKKLRDEIRLLKGLGPDDPVGDEEAEELEVADFMVPYRVRAAMATGKARWELLAQDASLARKKRDHQMGQKFANSDVAVPPSAQEVSAAFRFLSRPAQTLVEDHPTVLQAVRQLAAGPLQPTGALLAAAAAAGRRPGSILFGSPTPPLHHGHAASELQIEYTLPGGAGASAGAAQRATVLALPSSAPAAGLQTPCPFGAAGPQRPRSGSAGPQWRGQGQPPHAALSGPGAAASLSSAATASASSTSACLVKPAPAPAPVAPAVVVVAEAARSALSAALTPVKPGAPAAAAAAEVQARSGSAAGKADHTGEDADASGLRPAPSTAEAHVPRAAALPGPQGQQQHPSAGRADRFARADFSPEAEVATPLASPHPLLANSRSAAQADTLPQEHLPPTGPRSSTSLRAAAQMAVQSPGLVAAARHTWTPETLPAAWSKPPSKLETPTAPAADSRSPLPSGYQPRGGSWLGYNQRQGLSGAGLGGKQSRSAVELRGLGAPPAGQQEGFLPSGLPAMAGRKLRSTGPTWYAPP